MKRDVYPDHHLNRKTLNRLLYEIDVILRRLRVLKNKGTRDHYWKLADERAHEVQKRRAQKEREKIMKLL